jgi:hypothetical protein
MKKKPVAKHWLIIQSLFFCDNMAAIEASRAAEKARRMTEKEEWDRVTQVFAIDQRKKDRAVELVRSLPLAKASSGAWNFSPVAVSPAHLFCRKGAH